MRTTFRALLGFLFLTALCIGIGFGGYTIVKSRLDNNQASGGRGGGFFGAQEPTYTVDLLQFKREDFTPRVRGFGSISAGRTADARPLVSGVLLETSDRLVEGQFVNQGDVLFTIDPFEFDIAVKDAEIALRDAQAKLDTAKADLGIEEAALRLSQEQLELQKTELERQTSLRQQGIISAAALSTVENTVLNAQSAVDGRGALVSRAKAAIPAAELAVERAALTLERAQRNLNSTAVKAPFDGLVQTADFALGRQVSTNDVLAQLVDLEQLELKFQLSDEQLGGLLGNRGSRDVLKSLPVTLSWDIGSQVLNYEAVIDRTAVGVSENQGGIDVFARLQNINAGNVPPVGAFMSYSFPEPTLRGVFAVPAEAVSATGQMFSVSDAERIETFNVDIVRRLGDRTIVSGSAVVEGASFVARRFIQLGEGTKVNPNRPETPEEPEVAEAIPAGMPEDGPIDLSDAQKTCFAGLVADADLPDRPKNRLQGMIDSGTIGDPSRLKGMGERFDLDFDSCFPAAETPVAVAAAPAGFPTKGPVDLTAAQQACLIDLVQNSDLPDRPKGFIIPSLESGTIADPSRMAGLKERAGLDLDSCFPGGTEEEVAIEEPAEEIVAAGFPTEGPVDLTQDQQACLIDLIENSQLPDRPKSFIIPQLETGTIADPTRMAGLKERAGLDLDSCFPGSKA